MPTTPSLARTAALSGLWAAALVGCPAPNEDEPLVFATSPLAGVIDGADWTAEGGSTSAFISDDDGFFTTFFGEPQEDVCSPDFSLGPQVLTSLPTEVGEVEFSLSRNLTFSYEDDAGELQNDVSLNGGVRIDEIDEDAGVIRGAIVSSTSGHEVDGTFTVTICE
jgi:hypothetical protein